MEIIRKSNIVWLFFEEIEGHNNVDNKMMCNKEQPVVKTLLFFLLRRLQGYNL